MNRYWYWQILMNEAIANLIMFAVIALVLALFLKMLSNNFIYKPKLSSILKGISEFFSLSSALIGFTALFSSYVEQMQVFLFISIGVVAASIYASVWIDSR
jgi:hypothetical protein